MPMLRPPRTEGIGAVQEVPDRIDTAGCGGIWEAAEVLMLLSTFEHLARGALHRWWSELTQ